MSVTTWQRERATLASATAHNRPDEALEARRNMTALRLEEHIASKLAAAPPLTAEQRDKLVVLIRGGVAA